MRENIAKVSCFTKDVILWDPHPCPLGIPSPRGRGDRNAMKDIKKRFARGLRAEQTKAERLAWKQLRNRCTLGLKFRRQHVIEGFVVDFYCLEKRIAIEIDGSIHDKHQEYDDLRQTIIESKNIKVIRLKNEEILKNSEVVKQKIIEILSNGPSPSGRGKAEGQGEGPEQVMV